MNSKSLVIASLIVFSFGCAHSSDVAKTDVAPPAPEPVMSKIVEIDATPEPVERVPSSVNVVSSTPDEEAPHMDPEIQQVADAIQAEDSSDESSAEDKDCRSVTFTKKYLNSNKIKTPDRVGDAKDSVPRWKKGGFKVVKISPMKNEGKPFDICVYDNDQTGDIFVKKPTVSG